LLGAPGPHVRELWIVLHGYGQLAQEFLEDFRPIAAPHRLIAAPEALSRFYREAMSAAIQQDSPVGASWMTREDRGAEIEDYVKYLDAVHRELLARGVPSDGALNVLGFSQGVATAVRWAALGTRAPNRLILWAGSFPDDVDFAVHGERLAAARPVLVFGEHDSFVTSERLQAGLERLTAGHIPAQIVRFNGGHRLDNEVLATLAESAG
jgi:predicted esterase